MDRAAFEMNRIILLELFRDEENIDILIDFLQKRLLEAAYLYRYEIAAYYRDIIIGFTNHKQCLNGYKDLATRDKSA